MGLKSNKKAVNYFKNPRSFETNSTQVFFKASNVTEPKEQMYGKVLSIE